MSSIEFAWRLGDKAMFTASEGLDENGMRAFFDLLAGLDGVTDVYLDLSNLHVLPPIAGKVILDRYPGLADQGKRLYFCRPGDTMKIVMKLLGINHVVPIVSGM